VQSRQTVQILSDKLRPRVRGRDTVAGGRIPLEGVERYLAERLIGC